MSQIVPSQSFASLGVLQGADDRTPCESGPRRGPSVETSVAIQDRAVFGRIAIDARDFDHSRTSFGDPSEPFEETLSRIVDDDFHSGRTGIESAYKAEFAETEKTLRSELAEAPAKSTLEVVNIANNNITLQQHVMAQELRQLDSAAELGVQSDAVAARMALANAEQIMSHENVKELNRVMELHHQTFNRKNLFMKKC